MSVKFETTTSVTDYSRIISFLHGKGYTNPLIEFAKVHDFSYPRRLTTQERRDLNKLLRVPVPEPSPRRRSAPSSPRSPRRGSTPREEDNDEAYEAAIVTLSDNLIDAHSTANPDAASASLQQFNERIDELDRSYHRPQFITSAYDILRRYGAVGDAFTEEPNYDALVESLGEVLEE